MTGAALGAHLLPFAWHAQHLPEVHFAWQVQRRKHLQGVWGRSPTIDHYTTGSAFCVAGPALGPSQFVFAWQAQHWKHLQSGLGKAVDD